MVDRSIVRSYVPEDYRGNFPAYMAIGTLPFLPMAFTFFHGSVRIAFIAFIVLLFTSAVVSAKRRTA